MSGFKKSLLPCAISIASMFNANANIDGPFLNEAHLNGKVRTVYYNIENTYDKSRSIKPYRSGAWTGGLQVNLQSGYFNDILALGGSAYGVAKLSMDKDKFKNSSQLLDTDNKGFSKLGQLWADLQFSNDNPQPSNDAYSGNVRIEGSCCTMD